MTTPSGPSPRRRSSSPFQIPPEASIEQYAVEDLVSHDTYGVGRVVGIDPGGVTVNFGTQNVRVTSPFSKMAKL